jgi:hypothetical protein
MYFLYLEEHLKLISSFFYAYKRLRYYQRLRLFTYTYFHILYILYTGLFKMIVGVSTTCHTQYTWHSSTCIFYLIEQHCKFQLRFFYGRSPHAYVKDRLHIELELLLMSGMPFDTCWAFNERWNNRFYYKVPSCV